MSYARKRYNNQKFIKLFQTFNLSAKAEYDVYDNTDKQCVVATGFRWSITVSAPTTNTQPSQYAWAIVLVPDGYTANDFLSGAGVNELYEPTQNVLVSGTGAISTGDGAGNTTRLHEGMTNTKRKLREGDKLVFIVEPLSGLPPVDLLGQVQYVIQQ